MRELNEEDWVLCVSCCDLLGQGESENRMSKDIIRMLAEELRIDHYFIPSSNTVLVRIGEDTLDNPVLRDS